GLSYLGVLLGFLNKALLYTAIFAQEYYGLLGVMAGAALIGNTIAQLGAGTIAVRFMPYVQTSQLRWQKFNGMLLMYITAGILLVTILMLGARPLVAGFYSENSPLFNTYYSYTIVMFIGLAVSQFTTYVCYAHLETVLPTFMRDVGVKLWQTLTGIGFWASLYDFDVFLGLYVGGWLLWSLIQVLYLVFTGKYPIKLDPGFFKTRIGKMSVNYGLYSSLSQSSGIFVKHLDKLMIPALAATGLIAGANYELGFFMATVIIMPYRAIGPISFGVVARSFREGDMANIDMVYKKSSLNGMLVGLAAFLLIFINLDSFFLLRPDFAGARWVFFFLGLSYLFDIVNGINAYIMIASKHYRVDLWVNLALIIMVFITNYWLIPLYGEVGAAVATAASVFCYNIFRGIFIWNKFRIHPFSRKTLYLLLIALASLLLGMYLPMPAMLQGLEPYLQASLEVIIRSSPVVALYGLLLVGMKISPDMNQLIFQVLRKVGFFRKKA
ncbi:MAG: polysaccharide biosynthesis C-terminal domain-containing protein, partial [Bacteroidia bacterium]